MDLPLVTVGITAFNAEDTVEGAVRSALAQDWPQTEILVVDDCSTDGTAAVVGKLVAQYPQIRLLRHKVNGGEMVARNTLIGEAKGEFMVFFDDDDESAPNRVTEQVKRIVNYENLVPKGTPIICHAARWQHYPGGMTRVETTMGTRPGVAPAGVAVARRVMLGEPVRDGFGSCACCSQAGRLSTYRLAGGFDPAFRRAGDTEFCIRLALLGTHFVGVAEPLVTQQMMLSSDKSVETEFTYFKLMMEKHRALFRSDAEFKFALAWLALKRRSVTESRFDLLAGLIPLGLKHPISVFKRIVYATPMRSSRKAFRDLYGVSR